MPNPFAHVELSTDDVKKAKKFYAAVFAWKLNDMPAMAYTTIDVSGGVGGGLQKKQSPDQPTAWLPYVQVDDVKATMAKVVKAGGKATLDYQEIGDMGSIGIFLDPHGAALGLWAPKVAAAAELPPASAKKASKKATAKAAPATKKAAAPAKAAASGKNAAAPSKNAAAAPAKDKRAPAKQGAKKPAAVAAPAPSAAPVKKPTKKVAPPPPAPAPKNRSKKR
jgi:uncharacterized protein